MIIDSTYFNTDISLPQTTNNEGLNILNSFIQKHETDYLKKVLGYELWKAFTDEVDSGVSGSGEFSSRFTDLLEGAEYDYKGHRQKWEGFINGGKLSPIANYVYYRFVLSEDVQISLIGATRSNTDNQTRVNPTPTLVRVWNQMVSMNWNLYRFLETNKSVYPEWYVKCHLDEVFDTINRHGL